jgi:hypothetical protein
VREILAGLSELLTVLRIDPVFTFCADLEGKAVGMYVSGTYNAPVILVDAELIKAESIKLCAEMGGDETTDFYHGIRGTLIHELGHAYLEDSGLRTPEHDEDVVESFTRRYGLEGDVEGAVNLLDELCRRHEHD